MLDPTDQGFTSGRVSLTFREPPPRLASPRLLLYLPDRGSLPKFEDLLGGDGRKQMRCGSRGPSPATARSGRVPTFSRERFSQELLQVSGVRCLSPCLLTPLRCRLSTNEGRTLASVKQLFRIQGSEELD